MSNVAIIPARGGSQRIPQKNIKDFFGKPIISYAIEMALASNLFDEVMVSTDSAEIVQVAKKYGATVPFKRTEKNSDNFATLTDVLLEVIQNYADIGKGFENICCILPTAALVTKERLLEAYAVFKEKGFASVVPVIRFAYPIQRALKNSNGLLELREPVYIKSRSQDLESFYHDSGQFYWINTIEILKQQSIFTSRTGFIELDDTEAQDVDSLVDWDMLILKYKHKK